MNWNTMEMKDKLVLFVKLGDKDGTSKEEQEAQCNVQQEHYSCYEGEDTDDEGEVLFDFFVE